MGAVTFLRVSRFRDGTFVSVWREAESTLPRPPGGCSQCPARAPLPTLVSAGTGAVCVLSVTIPVYLMEQLSGLLCYVG